MLSCCCAKSYFISQQKLEHRLGYVNSFHVLSQMAVSFVGSLEQQQNVESRLAFEDLGSRALYILAYTTNVYRDLQGSHRFFSAISMEIGKGL